MQQRIFVQIPAYRDPELLATVTDLLRTASNPERLVVAVAWQYADGEAHQASFLRQLRGVRLLEIRAQDSLGCNWVRNMLQQGWAGEEFTLFLDSHHRFAPAWDDELVRMHSRLRDAGVERPILTGYLPPYDPHRDPEGRVRAVYRMDVAERHEGMMFRLTGHPIPGWERLTAPVPACFTSLHFLFTEGRFNQAVLFDPEIYFFADEVAIALRAFTCGYDLFHPHTILGWHLYDRSTRVTHWSDHASWRQQHQRSAQRLRALFGGSLVGPYGLGRQRTLAEYEALAGELLIAPDGLHPLTEGDRHEAHTAPAPTRHRERAPMGR